LVGVVALARGRVDQPATFAGAALLGSILGPAAVHRHRDVPLAPVVGARLSGLLTVMGARVVIRRFRLHASIRPGFAVGKRPSWQLGERPAAASVGGPTGAITTSNHSSVTGTAGVSRTIGAGLERKPFGPARITLAAIHL